MTLKDENGYILERFLSPLPTTEPEPFKNTVPERLFRELSDCNIAEVNIKLHIQITNYISKLPMGENEKNKILSLVRRKYNSYL